MFDDLVVSSAKGKGTNKVWKIILSACLHFLLLGILILIPLIYTEAIDLKALSSTFLVAPPPPPPPPPAAAPIVKVKPITRIIQAGRMMTPTAIPKQVAMIKEEEMPPEVSNVGVMGGVPGGVPGGSATGVLGGILGGTGMMPPPPKATATRIRVGGQVQNARLISQIKPVYPPLARQARIAGTVRLHAIIAKDGSVQRLEVLGGHPLLVQAALDAVRQWRYQPTLLNGEPVEVETTVDVVFTLST